MATLYRSVEESIARFRSGFKSLGIPEHDVKVTWDLEQRWARMRVRLPSGRILNICEDPAEGESVEAPLWRLTQRLHRAVKAVRGGVSIDDALIGAAFSDAEGK